MGNNQIPFQGNGTPPAVGAIATTIRDTTATVSSIRTLTADTTAIEIAATGGPVYMKWLKQSVVDSSVAGTSVLATGAANFDHVIPNNTYRRFVIPIATNNPQGYSSMVGANIENGLFPAVAIIGGTGASVIGITQYGSSNSY